MHAFTPTAFASELAWAMKKHVSLVQLADNFMPFKYITVK